MKFLQIILLLILSNGSFSQVYTLNVDKYQRFSYPKHLVNINNAIAQDSIQYFNGGPLNIDYTFNIDDSVLIYQYPETGNCDTLKIIYYETKKEGGCEIWALNAKAATPFYHYLITRTISHQPVFICRWTMENSIEGWFSPSINRFSTTDKNFK